MYFSTALLYKKEFKIKSLEYCCTVIPLFEFSTARTVEFSLLDVVEGLKRRRLFDTLDAASKWLSRRCTHHWPRDKIISPIRRTDLWSPSAWLALVEFRSARVATVSHEPHQRKPLIKLYHWKTGELAKNECSMKITRRLRHANFLLGISVDGNWATPVCCVFVGLVTRTDRLRYRNSFFF